MTDDRFQRLKLLLGAEKFSKLQNSTVAIFGIGGVGSFTAEALARSGIGHLVLIDKDNIDITNINRQIHALSSTVGKSKVEVMRDRILNINPAAKVLAVQKFYLPDADAGNFFIDNYDFVVDAIDTISAKINLICECQRRGIKIISSMGAGNKFDPTRFKVADIFQTSVDPVAKILRKKLKELGVKNLKVVYSDELPQQIEKGDLQGKIIGSTAFVPPVVGLIMAAEVVKDLGGI